MNVASVGLREIIIDDEVDALKIQTTRHQVRRDQDPYPPLSERVNHIVTLRLAALRVNHFDINAVKDELVEQRLGTIDGLDKDQDRRLDALLDKVTDRNPLAFFTACKQKLLLDGMRGRVSKWIADAMW